MKVVFNQERQSRKIGVIYIYYTIAALLISLLQVSVVGFISVGGITPDLLLILIVWIVLSEGRFYILFAAFGYGLIFDLLSNDIMGMNALTKTVVAFLAGFFYREGKSDLNLATLRFPLIVFLCAVVHNAIYLFFYVKAGEMSFISFFLINGIAASFYTTVFSLFPMLLRLTRRRW